MIVLSLIILSFLILPEEPKAQDIYNKYKHYEYETTTKRHGKAYLQNRAELEKSKKGDAFNIAASMALDLGTCISVGLYSEGNGETAIHAWAETDNKIISVIGITTIKDGRYTKKQCFSFEELKEIRGKQ